MTKLKTIGGRFLQIALTLVFLCDFTDAQKTLTADAHFKRGLAKMKLAQTMRNVDLAETKYEQAAADFSGAIELEPENAEFYFYRGRCFYKSRSIEKAIWDFNAAIKLEPDYA